MNSFSSKKLIVSKAFLMKESYRKISNWPRL
jgi:hypothetical protein